MTSSAALVAEILEDIVAQLPGATVEFVQRELAATARDCFPRIQSWVLDIALAPVAGVADYNLHSGSAMAGLRFSAIDAVAYDCAWLPPARPLLRHDGCLGTPRYWWSPTPGMIRLWPAPDAEQPDGTARIGVRGRVTPARGLEPIPEEVIEPIRDVLTLGTLARLFRQPAKPWTSQPLAIFNGRLYNIKMMRAKQDVARQRTGGATSWRFPPMGVGRRRGGATAGDGAGGFCCGHNGGPPIIDPPVVPDLPALSVSDGVLEDVDEGPFMGLSDTSVGFGSVPVDTDSDLQYVTLTNLGTEALVISSVSVI